MNDWRGKGEKPEHVTRQQEKQAAAKLEQLKRAPALLTRFSFSVMAVCPATQQEITLSGPRPHHETPPLRNPDGTRRPVQGVIEEMQRPDQPWNQPHLQLHGWGYDTDGGTNLSGITLSIWHCPACGGQHDIEVDGY